MFLRYADCVSVAPCLLLPRAFPRKTETVPASRLCRCPTQQSGFSRLLRTVSRYRGTSQTCGWVVPKLPGLLVYFVLCEKLLVFPLQLALQFRSQVHGLPPAVLRHQRPPLQHTGGVPGAALYPSPDPPGGPAGPQCRTARQSSALQSPAHQNTPGCQYRCRPTPGRGRASRRGAMAVTPNRSTSVAL